MVVLSKPGGLTVTGYSLKPFPLMYTPQNAETSGLKLRADDGDVPVAS